MKTLIILTIINTIAILYLLYKKTRYYVEIEKRTSSYKKTFLGYALCIWKAHYPEASSARCVFRFKILFKNAKKVELKEEIEGMMQESNQNKLQRLTAKFSWLKTWEEVWQFEEDYGVVDRKIVEKLITNFTPKK